MFFDITTWVASIIIIGFLGLPLSSILFKGENLFIKLSLGIPLSLISLGVISWISFFIFGNIYYSSLFSIVIYIVIFIFWGSLNFSNIKTIYSYQSLAFLIILVGSHLIYLSLRAFNGDLLGTEKLMDQMMLSSSYYASNNYIPDLWLSDYQNPYYYLGYWIYGGLLKVNNISINIGYNFALATTFSLTFIVSWSITFKFIGKFNLNRINKITASLIGPIYILLITNFYIFFEILTKIPLFKIYIPSFLGIKGLGNTSGYFFSGSGWESTRVIDYLVDGSSLDYTIQEYPSFSFILGDLHPHLISIPFLLVSSYLIINLIINNRIEEKKDPRRYKSLFKFFCIGFLIPIIGFINIWDLPFLLFFLFVLYIIYSRKKINKKIIFEILSILFGLSFSFLVFSKFYFYSLGGQAKFPYILPNDYSTNILHFLIVSGVLILVIYWDLFSKFKVLKINFVKLFSLTLILTLLIFIIRTIFSFNKIDEFYINNYLLSFITTLIILLPIIIIIKGKLYEENKIFYSISLVALLILLIVEHVHLADLFGNRMNTIFKSYYQVWILGSILLPIFIIKNIRIKRYKYKLSSLLILVATLSLIQNYSTITDSTNNFSKRYTLNSAIYINDIYPGSLDSIEWIKANTKLSDVIYSGPGIDYQTSSFLSVFSGRQTPLGWPGHENQWRGNDIEIESRKNDLDKIFNNASREEIDFIVKKYNISYIISYSGTNSELINLYNTVYAAGSYKIFVTKN